jgi:hypothetical protein
MAHEPAPDPALPARPVLRAAVTAGAPLQRNPWSRLTWIERNGRARLYAAGVAHDCGVELAQRLCGPLDEPFSLSPDSPAEDLDCALDLLTSGHLLMTAKP